MGFCDRYIHSLNTSDLRDDVFHHQTNALAASAIADGSTRGIGSLLHRVKYAGTMARKVEKASAERQHFFKLLGDAERRKDEAGADECRRELANSANASTDVGGEADAFRSLVRHWLVIVTEKGAARGWVKSEDVAIAHILYRRVADASLAHYLDGKCKPCGGTGVNEAKQLCVPCKGCGDAELPPMRPYEARLTLDMLSELMSLESAHSGAANALLRKDL